MFYCSLYCLVWTIADIEYIKKSDNIICIPLVFVVSFFIQYFLKGEGRFYEVDFIYKRTQLLRYAPISGAYIEQFFPFLTSEYILDIFFIQEIRLISEHTHDVVVFYSYDAQEDEAYELQTIEWAFSVFKRFHFSAIFLLLPDSL